MRCFLTNGQGIDQLKLIEKAAPKIINPHDVLIDVKACSLNYRDLMVAEGTYGGPANYPPFIPLSDMSGIVCEIGSNVRSLKPGDRVISSPFRHWPAGRLQENWAKTFAGGAGVDGVLAEQVIYPEDALVKLPNYLDFHQGCTFTIAGLTAWSSVITHGKVQPGEWVLLHGTGGVSLFAAQLAHTAGANIILTTSDEQKAQFVKKHFGVFATINYKDPLWPEKVKEITSSIDLVVDVVGGEMLRKSLGLCGYGARVAIVGALGGTETTIQTRDLLKHQIRLQGTYMESTQELKAFMRAAEACQLKPHIDQVFTFEKTKEAYQHLKSQKHMGKVVISFFE